MYDTSYWEIVPDFARVSPRPLIVSTKATEGSSIRDPKFLQYWADLKQDGIRRQAYHFHRKAIDERMQADNFIFTLRAGGITNQDVLELDIEEGGESAKQIIDWLDLVEAAFPDNLIIIYSRKNILDLIPMTPIQAQRLRKYPIWTAGYPANPDLYSVPPASYIPDPAKWGEVWQWQYSDKAIVQGITGAVDVNWISPKMIAWLGSDTTPQDAVTFPHAGMQRVDGVTSGWKWVLFILDSAKWRFELVSTPNLETVPSVARRKGALLATNAGEWNDRDASLPSYLKPIDYTVSNSIEVVARDKLAARPSFQVQKDTNFVILDTHNITNVAQAFTGLRPLVTNGGISTLLFDFTKAQNTEGHTRMIAGTDAAGNAMLMLSEGRYPNQGLRLFENAQIMQRYGAQSAADFGGGGDGGGVLDGMELIVPENSGGAYRALPMTFCVYAKDVTMNGKATENLGKIPTVRSSPQVISGNSVSTLPARSIVEFTEIVPDLDATITRQWLHLANGNYVNYTDATHTGATAYFVITQQPTTPADSITIDINLYDVKATGDQYQILGAKAAKVK